MSETPDTPYTPDETAPAADAGADGVARPQNTRGRLLLAAGVALVAVAIGIVVYQLWPDISYNLGLVDEEWPYTSAFGESVADQPAEMTIPKGNRVVIPKIGVDAPIAGGDSDVALSQGVYHHVETDKPGEGGNVALAGHRERETFALLYQLQAGDPVSVWWGGEEHTYRVTRIYDVTPDDTGVLAATNEERLTLYTCLPRFMGNKRTVVEAEVANPYPSQAP